MVLFFFPGSVQDIVGDVRTPDCIAVDWVGRKIYWTDGDLNMIEVAELDGTNRMTLYSAGLDEPRAIAVDPSTGYSRNYFKMVLC